MKNFTVIVILGVMLLGCVQGVHKKDFDLRSVYVEPGTKIVWTREELREEYYRKQGEELDSFRFDSTLFTADTVPVEHPENHYQLEDPRSPFNPHHLHKTRRDG